MRSQTRIPDPDLRPPVEPTKPRPSRRSNPRLPPRTAPSQPVLPTQPGQAGLAKHPDLVIEALRLDRQGIRYVVRNRGGAPTDRAFISSVYVDGERIETVPHGTLAGGAAIKITAGEGRVEGCSARRIGIVVDEQQRIGEFDEDNNQRAATFVPPCPDLAVTSIHKDWKNLNTMYQVQVTIRNLGNAPSPPETTIWATSMPQSAGVTGWPEFDPTHWLDALRPGEEVSSHVGGNVAGPESTYVDVAVDLRQVVEESDESNNRAKKRL